MLNHLSLISLNNLANNSGENSPVSSEGSFCTGLAPTTESQFESDDKSRENNDLWSNETSENHHMQQSTDFSVPTLNIEVDFDFEQFKTPLITKRRPNFDFF